ncbi:MAG: FecR domain-containing protein [Ginsengibacter sp.]
MQNSFDTYQHYRASDFALDDNFIDWVLFPDDEKDEFWNHFIITMPAQKKNIKTAKSLILSFDNSRQEAPEEIKKKIWQSIISKTENGRIVKMKSRKWWMVAASVLIIIIGALTFSYLNKNENKKNQDIAGNSKPKNDIAPGGNKAVLTLANGNTIVLDSAQNGTLSQQGNAKVVKQVNGQLIYQKDENIHSDTVQYNTITTPRGGQYQLVLEDGSKVWLNAASSIRFPTAFTGKERDVQITGEAYFEVVHNAEMPFHVKVNDMEVTVLGTHFNISAYEDEGLIKTTLLEGSVKVSNKDKSVMIVPGEQAQIAENTNQINIKKQVDLEEVVAWKNGKFIFHDADIQAIMRQLERWYNITVSYGPNLSNEEFEGVISRNVNLSQILSMLQKTSAVKFEVDGRRIIVK